MVKSPNETTPQVGGTQTGSYQTGSYQKGRFIPPKPKSLYFICLIRPRLYASDQATCGSLAPLLPSARYDSNSNSNNNNNNSNNNNKIMTLLIIR